MFYDNRYVSKINSNNCCIVHGDLSYENILWKNNIPYLIDFDECCFAPKEYEYANFLIKNCFIKNKFNVTLAKKIIKAAKYNNVDILNLKYNFYLYIIKVIIEKIYYHLLLGLDLESEEQKKDYWKWWYYLLLNDKTIDSIFIDN